MPVVFDFVFGPNHGNRVPAFANLSNIEIVIKKSRIREEGSSLRVPSLDRKIGVGTNGEESYSSRPHEAVEISIYTLEHGGIAWTRFLWLA